MKIIHGLYFCLHFINNIIIILIFSKNLLVNLKSNILIKKTDIIGYKIKRILF
jgi:hypothetical protein